MQKLGKNKRIKGRSRIEALFSRGTSGFEYPFKYFYTVSPTGKSVTGSFAGHLTADKIPPADNIAGLFSVPKKYHKRANKRNLLKRRIKESFRLSLPGDLNRNGKQIDIAFIYITKDILDYKTIKNAVDRVIRQVMEDN